MSKHQIWLIAIISSFSTVAIIAGSMLFFSWALAASSSTTTQQTIDNFAFVSISSLAFEPVDQNAAYNKDVKRQMLTLNSQTGRFVDGENIFIAPLILPDKSILTGMTVFGEDFDNQGAVQLRLKRCYHNQARCINLAETTSTDSYAAGQFETVKVTIPNEVVDNNFYSYILELELTALSSSGLRSVRLEMVDRSGTAASPADVNKWSLAGEVTNFLLPNSDLTQVRVCTDDLSHLKNATHYPRLVVDGKSMPLSSNSCVTVWGRDIEVQRALNTGPSSGTYQFLR